MKGPLEIHHYLVAHEIPHEIVRLPRGIPSADHLADALAVDAGRCVAVRPYLASTGGTTVMIAVLCPLSCSPDLGALRRAALAPALVPARSDRVSAETDYIAGHLSPLLLPPEVVVLAASPLAALGDTIVYTATGDGGTAVGLPASDLLSVTGARSVTTTAPATRGTTIVLPEAATSPPAERLSERPATAGR